MKKIFTLALLACSLMPAGAQTTQNLFPSTVTDADGWLWFNNQNVIDTYVGDINTDDEAAFRIDVNGKPIQKVFANQSPDYPEAVADPAIAGAGTDGNLGTTGARTGAIIVPPSAGFGAINGGGVAFNLPALATLSICLSSERGVAYRLSATTNAQNDLFTWKASGDTTYPLDGNEGYHSIKVTSVFSTLKGTPGITTWEGLEKLNNNDGITIKSDKPIYVFLQSGTRDTLFIHGVKITIPASTTGITGVAATKAAPAAVYTADGQYVGPRLTGLRGGLYVVKENGKARKVVIR